NQSRVIAPLEAMPADAAVVAMIQALIPLGLQAVEDALQQEVTRLAGPRYAHGDGPSALVRWGGQRGSVFLADQKLAVHVPRVRDRAMGREVPLATYHALQTPRAGDVGLFRRVLAGISTREYRAAAEAVPEAFGLARTSVLQGRGILASDRVDTDPVAVVNQMFVDQHLGGKDPLGKRIRPGGLKSTEPWRTIVGVVPTGFSGRQDRPRTPEYYMPLTQNHSNFVYVAVATAGPPMAITGQVRSAVASLNPDIPMYWIYSMEEALARPTWFIRVFGTMFMIFGFIALFLASIGLYAVMSFSVSRRVREVGIRMALGAQSRDVVGMIFRQGIVQVAVGMVLGLGLAAGVAQFMQVILFDVQPRDPLIFGGVVAVLGTVALIACLVPARRATLIDPLVALRAD
ncbi:MAG: ABC transporter permease, partial [Gemmatimonadetes bacterium]|nr:ABC transporter permease [Gemmatimonadota bacterium]